MCAGAVNHPTAAPLTGSGSAEAMQPTFRLLCLQKSRAHNSEETKVTFALGSHSDAMFNYPGNMIVPDGLGCAHVRPGICKA